MIVGTGIDMIEVSRIGEKLAKENGFTSKVFSKHEIELCNARQHPNEHYAARFAAKEAFLKATGLGLAAGYDLHEIEIVNNEAGKPEIRLNGNFEKLASENDWKKIHLSLSHLEAVACAVVIIEK
jgi:holo-[acyl-carrier protein] synthase